jgi:DNA-binding transcriptional ArsR family regulator
LSVDGKLATAIAHPLRHRLLTILNERVASPTELADELGERLGNVSYHVSVLADLGLLELVRMTSRRGAIEHHYRGAPVPLRGIGRTVIVVDDRGREELADLLERTLVEVRAVEAGAKARLDQAAGHGRRRVEVAIAHMELPMRITADEG